MTPEKPRQNRVREALGRIYDHQPPYFREYLRRYQEDPTSRVFAPLAETYRRLGRVDDAIAVCVDGLKHHPDFHAGRVALAKCYIEKKSFTEARQELDRVVQTVPENLLAQRLLGDVCAATGDIATALHAYKMAQMMAPSDVSLADRIHQLERTPKAPEANLAPSALAPEAAPAPVSAEANLEVAAAPEQILESEKPTPTDESALPPVSRVALDDWGDLPPLWDLPAEPKTFSDEPAKAKAEVAPEPPKGQPQGQGLGAELAGWDASDDSDDAFSIEHVSQVFKPQTAPDKREITTETLGDLYFSQGQHDKALRIFEKIAERFPSETIERKLNACRLKLGVDTDALARKRKIESLRGVLHRLKDN